MLRVKDVYKNEMKTDRDKAISNIIVRICKSKKQKKAV